MGDALAGMKVVAFAHLAAGPLTAQYLGAFGADTIKVEAPGGDLQRTAGVHPDGKFGGCSPFFVTVSRNQRSISVDLKLEDGKEVVRELLRTADVVIENFRPGALERLGFGYEDVRKYNERIIYCSISAYDRNGSRRNDPGQDLLLQAESGIAAQTGSGEGPPFAAGTFVMDWYTSTHAVIGILAALRYRDRTNKGQWVRVDMMSSAMHLLCAEASYAMNVGVPIKRGKSGLAHPIQGAPYGIYQTSDGEIAISARSAPHVVRDIAERLGALDKVESYLSDRDLKLSNKERVAEALGERIGTMTTQEVTKRLKGAEIWGVAAIRSVAQALEDPAVIDSDIVRGVKGQYGGEYKVVIEPVKMSESPVRVTQPAPALGEHTVQILKELGYSARAIDDLIAKKVVLCAEAER